MDTAFRIFKHEVPAVFVLPVFAMADEMENIEGLDGGFQSPVQQFRGGIEQQFDLSQVGIKQAAESAADDIGFLLDGQLGQSQGLGDDHEDTQGTVPDRDAFSRNGGEDIPREIHLFQREERLPIGIIDELPCLIGDLVDIGCKDKIEPLTRLLGPRRVVKPAHLAGKQRLEQGAAEGLKFLLTGQRGKFGVALDVSLDVFLCSLDLSPLYIPFVGGSSFIRLRRLFRMDPQRFHHSRVSEGSDEFRCMVIRIRINEGDLKDIVRFGTLSHGDDSPSRWHRLRWRDGDQGGRRLFTRRGGCKGGLCVRANEASSLPCR